MSESPWAGPRRVITQAMLRRHFDSGSFARGEGYHRQGRVCDLRSEAGQDGTVRVTAQVRGSLPSPYRQDIRLVLRNGAIASVSGECDCPVGVNCKHVAAALLAWAGSRPATAPAPAPPREPGPPPAVRLLLSRLEEAAALDAGDTYPEAVRTRLVYVLRLDEQPGGCEASRST